MSFFKEPTGDPMHEVTTTIGTIAPIPYTIIETTTMLLLLLIKLYKLKLEMRKSKYLFGLMVICQIIVMAFNIRYWVTGIFSLAPLIVRPFFLTV
jgi:hypothetical protein